MNLRRARPSRPSHAPRFRSVPLGLRAAGAIGVVAIAAMASTAPAGRLDAVGPTAPAPVRAPQYGFAAPGYDPFAAATTAYAAQPGGPLRPPGSAVAAVPPIASGLAADGIPTVALLAYQRAAARLRATDPGCRLPWTLLAAIGRVESDHGRFAGAQLRTDGTSTRAVIGIALDGIGTALIRDTDRGRLDGDTHYDRAVGPMQFIPSTWAGYGVDGNGDSVADPFNIYDAALSAGYYLCAAGGDLSTRAGKVRAVLAYNHSDAYLAAVLLLEATYAAGGAVPVAVAPYVPEPGSTPTLPPVDPGRPAAVGPLPAPRSAPSTTRSGSPPSTAPPASSAPASAPAPVSTSAAGPSPSATQTSACPTVTLSPTTTASAPGATTSAADAPTASSTTVAQTPESSPAESTPIVSTSLPETTASVSDASGTDTSSPDASPSRTNTGTGTGTSGAAPACPLSSAARGHQNATSQASLALPVWLAVAALLYALFRKPARVRPRR